MINDLLLRPVNHITVTSRRYGVYRHGLHHVFGEMGQELGREVCGGHGRKDRENDGAGRKSGKTA